MILSTRQVRPPALIVSVEADALHLHVSRRNADVASLMRLVAVQPATAYPLSLLEGSFLSAQDAGDAAVRRVRGERKCNAGAGNEELIGAKRNDQAAARGGIVGGPRIDERRGYGVAAKRVGDGTAVNRA